MIGDDDPERDLAVLVVPQSGRLAATGNRYEPYRLLDPDGVVVEAVAASFSGTCWRPGSLSPRSARMAMICCDGSGSAGRAGVAWERATRVDARDFSRWLQVAGKQPRPHWRRTQAGLAGCLAGAGEAYAPSVRAHSETVLRSFYDFHRDAGTGPVINPFPLDRSRRGGRAHAHHNPMEPYGDERSGLYRPRVPSQDPAQHS